MRTLRNLFLYLSVLLGLSGCTDELYNIPDIQSEMTGTSVDSIFNGNCNTYALSFNLGLEGEISTEGDFFTFEKKSEKWNLYLEENNDGNSRVGKITALQKDGTQRTFTFLQRSRSLKEFDLNKRNYGLGYSYDGYGGEKCDPNSVLCQVINLAEVKKLQDESSMQLMSTDFNKSVLSTKLNSAYSWAEFVHNANISGGVKANVIIYKGEYVKTMSLLEYQRENYVFICSEQYVEKAKLELFSNNLQKSIQENPQILTHSFRKALAHLKENPKNLIRIDSFLVRFGSHVVTSSTMGGSLKLYNSISRKSFTDLFEKKHFENHQIPLLFKQMKESSEEYNYEKAINSSSLSLKVKGGKLASMNEALFNPSFKNPNITEKALTEWIGSVCFSADIQDVGNADKNNAEMIDMEITPIWEFITDDEVKKVVKARAEGTAYTLAEIFGEIAYPNVRITYNFGDDMSNIVKGKLTSLSDISVVFVISRGKIVATICREYLPVNRNVYMLGNPLNIIYPVFDGKIDLTAGYLVPNEWTETSYNVAWVYDTLNITESENGVSAGDGYIETVYLTNGRFGSSPVDGVQYEEGALLAGLVFPGSIHVDGSMTDNPYYKIRKFLGHFYLNTMEKFDNLPGWSYQTELPNEFVNLNESVIKYIDTGIGDIIPVPEYSPDYFKNRMVMNEECSFRWNPNEINIP